MERNSTVSSSDGVPTPCCRAPTMPPPPNQAMNYETYLGRHGWATAISAEVRATLFKRRSNSQSWSLSVDRPSSALLASQRRIGANGNFFALPAPDDCPPAVVSPLLSPSHHADQGLDVQRNGMLTLHGLRSLGNLNGGRCRELSLHRLPDGEDVEKMQRFGAAHPDLSS